MLFIQNFLELFLSAAPWLLFGYFVAAVINLYVPTDMMVKYLGGHSFGTTVKAALIGAPLPLCSCGVIPAALGLRRAGASKNATTSFLIATPETGVDSIAVSYALLGPVMTIARPLAAIFSAILAGFLVGKSEEEETNNKTKNKLKNLTPINNCSQSKDKLANPSFEINAIKATKGCCSTSPKPEETTTTSCCSSKPTKEAKPSCCSSKPAKEVTSSCCSSSTPQNGKPKSKLKLVFDYTFGNLVSDTYKWIFIGILFAAVIQTFIPTSWLIQWGDGWLAMLVMTLIGIPMYICATGSTPIAAGFLLAGISPGAVLVFMLAGPATNVATLALVKQELGMRALVSYLTGVIGGAWIFGIAVDWIINNWNLHYQPGTWSEEAVLYSWPVVLLSIILAVAMIRAMLKEYVPQLKIA
ncbi:SO_0444 family Cu/Zn efflux transporter [Vibrio sp. SS-MA-C1-2]|uniref:SO_0444 family Cu/Zn efflux transporter n=1 Tax=Vibrio sp. SS-MA-C1-2 TaxID=2908646 RepID=UPI001F21C446|nr:SO_0444 family Cu/Zn efflux transporter [Vibrio sp. SS-MA-C1-2]UJF16945.1 SO_0444 family Cu/Zn efflux transporter [Vibrio sp. SS-MA-C1-2]